MSGQYGAAEICVNGHPTTSDLELLPEMAARFCPECGSRTIRACPSCGVAIRGNFHVEGVFGLWEYVVPNHCHGCGTQFPWMTAKLEAAIEHVSELEGIDEAEKAQLGAAIKDLALGGPKTELAAGHFNRLMKKAGEAVGSGLYKIVIDVASEVAKKAIGG